MLAEVLSILAGAFLASAATVIVVSAFRSVHECGLTPIAVDHHQLIMGPAKTVVLRRCPGCGTVETTTLDGRFTLAQVQGENEPEEVPDGRS